MQEIEKQTVNITKFLKENADLKEYQKSIEKIKNRVSIWIPERIKEDTDTILEEMTKQDKEQRQIYGLIAQKFKDQREKMQEQNDKVVSAIIKLLEKVQEERDGNLASAAVIKGKESATFARTRGIMRLNVPTKKKNIQRASILEDIQKTPLLQETRPGLKESKIVIATTAGKKDTGPHSAPSRTFQRFPHSSI